MQTVLFLACLFVLGFLVLTHGIQSGLAQPSDNRLTSPLAEDNPLPVLDSISPASVLAGSTSQTLTFSGSGFVTTSVAYSGALALPTTYVSAVALSVSPPDSLLTTARTFSFHVNNPAPGGGDSNSKTFTVENPAPVLDSISPASVLAGSTSQTLTFSGSGFVAASQAYSGTTALPTTFVNASTLHVSPPDSLLTTARTFSFHVNNPSPGGGNSSTRTFTVLNPTPALNTIFPPSVLVGATSQILTFSGSGFVAASQAYSGTTALPTTYVSDSILYVSPPDSLLTTARTFSFHVSNPSPGGGSSVTRTFTVLNPAPTLITISPSSVLVGATSQMLTFSGSGFVAASQAYSGTTALPTTYVSAFTLHVYPPDSLLTTARTYSFHVNNPSPGGGNSSTRTFTVQNPTPALNTISPSNVLVGATSQTLTFSGSGFIAASVAYSGTTALPTTYVSANTLQVSPPDSLLTTARTFSFHVNNPSPGGGNSSTRTFTVLNPTPLLSSISPPSVLVGATSQTLTFSGSGFIAASVAYSGSQALPTTYVSASTLSVSPPDDLLTSAGVFSFTVSNPAPGGGTSTAITFTVENPLPALDAINPPSVLVGSASQVLTITGAGFIQESVIRWDSQPLTTFFVSNSVLTATVDESLLANVADIEISVFNPPPGGGSSDIKTFVVTKVQPVLSTINPQSALVSAASFTLQVTGSDFLSGAQVKWGSILLSTSYLNSSSLAAVVNSNLLSTAGTISVTVANPSPAGGISNALPFTILNPKPVLNAIQPASLPDRRHNFTLQVEGQGFIHGVSTLLFNGSPHQATVESGSRITADISASELAPASSFPVQVRNAGPGGGDSNALALLVGNNIYLPSQYFELPPQIPELPPITNLDGTGSFIVSWTSSTNATGYELWQARQSDFSDAISVYSGAFTSHLISGLGPSRYFYRVRAINAWSQSEWSNSQQVDVIWEMETNNSFSTANGFLVSGLDYHGYYNDQMDLYKYMQTGTGTIQVDLTGAPADGVNLVLYYRSSQNRVGIIYSSPYTIEALDQPPGIYYIYIYTPENRISASYYTLRVTGQ